MSAAIEGAMEGISSIGFSLADYEPNADFSASKYFASIIIEKALNSEFPDGVCLNVNFPKLKKSEIKGIKICKQAHAFWADRFDKRKDQFGRSYFWLTGEFSDVDQRPDTDLHVLKEGYVSVVPTLYDLTAYDKLTHFQNWHL
jgi:5'-nucleotidase